MSMHVHHFVGYYFKCNKNDDVDSYSIFPDNSMTVVYDEGGSKQINDFHIYIPNRDCSGCYRLDQESDTGLTVHDANDKLPDLIKKAIGILTEHYESVEMRYGVVSYVC